MTRDYPQISRRNALRTVAGAALTSVAGCLNDGGSSGTPGDGTTDPDSGPLTRVAVEGTTLVVELSAEANVDQINLIQPNGALFGKRDVAVGAQQVSFEIGTAYDPGEYRVVALKGEESVVETSLPIQPSLTIVEMGIGRNQPEKMWDGSSDEITEEAFVTVENQGSGPDAITKLLFIGDVPYPSDEEGTNYANNEDVSGIYDPQSDSEVSEVIVAAGDQVTMYSSRSPFAFVPGSGTSCKDEQQSGEFELILETPVEEAQLTKSYNIQYSASTEADNCEITISES
ncbi:hypothetical protein SAMN04487949_3522 [Halogranum gelatinilyticum]|uniref:Secreted glycoprotein n=1 Tax=Halogranum gelatinilyticum TaxID=660521 RepID=A0A1G9Z2P7_9EURY|nr:hypothetical protein [Halogranum gelatinilyticum]SDN15614.1 hypothetical protein SAMN04487949_3522 [Halogranum gelatinilyticum]